MIAHLTGTVTTLTDTSIVLDVNGVGYLVSATSSCIHSCSIGGTTTLNTYQVVREQALDLYGFTEAREKEMFELLITISGIGPKVALGILNAAMPETLVEAILKKDSSVLTKVSGIGKKNAEKILLELENKVNKSWLEGSSSGATSELDVFEALEALGYSPRAIQEALKSADLSDMNEQEKIKHTLRLLSK